MKNIGTMIKLFMKFLLTCLVIHTFVLISTQNVTAKRNRKTIKIPTMVEEYIAGFSVKKRPIECVVLGNGKKVTLIIASIHGNERVGTLLVRQLEKFLWKNPQLLLDNKVILVPIVNPDGYHKNHRWNARGIDLNRNFSAPNRINNNKFGKRAFSEPETVIIRELIQGYSPRCIISFHQPLACIDFDGPGDLIADHIAKYCHLGIKKLGTLPGSLGAYAGLKLQIPVISLELPFSKKRKALNERRLWKRYGKALLAALSYPEMVKF